VGDGPVIGATVTLTDANGEVVRTGTSDGSANYDVELPEDVATPVLVSAAGGTDVVTGDSPDFLMLSAVTNPEQGTANISPITTLVVRAAQCTEGGLSEESLSSARQSILERFGFGLDPRLVPDPITTRIGNGNVADIIKANEAVSEMVRRTHDSLLGTGAEMSPDELVTAIACGFVGRTPNGMDSDTTVRVSASAYVVAAQILGELLSNQLMVNGIEAIEALDAAVNIAVPGAPAEATMASVPLAGELLEQARIATQAAITVAPSTQLVEFAAAIESLAPGSLPADAAATMPPGLDGALAAAVDALATTSGTTLALANDRVAAAATTSKPTVTFSSTPATVTSGEHATLDWDSTGATVCAASESWGGLKPVSGTWLTGLLTAPETYRLICSGAGGTVTETLTVGVAPGNNAPVAVADSASTPEDTPVTINVLSNDSDPDGDSLAVQSVTQGANGSVSTDGATVTYSPNANYNGTDAFTYQLTDGNGDIDSASVSVTVGGTNDPPVAGADSASTPEDTPVTIDVLSTDSDPDGDSLAVQSVTQGVHGSVTTNGLTVTYVPNVNFNGSDVFTYVAADGKGGTDSANVNVTVSAFNDTPVASTDSASTPEDTPVTINVRSNDSDPDGDGLAVQSVTQGAHGSVTTNGLTVTYSPSANFNGNDAFTYVVADGKGGTDSADVNVTVGALNDAPVAQADSASTPEDTPVTINVLSNDSDPDGDSLTV